MKNIIAVLIAFTLPLLGTVKAQEVVSKQLSIGHYGVNNPLMCFAGTSHSITYDTENLVGSTLIHRIISTNEGKGSFAVTNIIEKDGVRLQLEFPIPFEMPANTYELRAEVTRPGHLYPVMDFSLQSITVRSPIRFPTGKRVLHPGQRLFVRWNGKKLVGGCDLYLHINSETNTQVWNLGTNVLSKGRMRIKIPTNAPTDIGYYVEIRPSMLTAELLGAVGPALSVQPRVRRF